MYIEVRECSGISIFMEVPREASMIEIKQAIREQLDVEPGFQSLLYHGSLLDDQCTVGELDLTEGSVVTLVLGKQIPDAKLAPLVTADAHRQFMEFAESQNLTEACSRICKEYELDDLLEMNSELQASPEALLQVHRLTDLALTNIEGIPGAYRELLASYEEIDEVEQTIFAANEGKSNMKTVIPEKLDAPSCEPLPMMFFDEEDVCVGAVQPALPMRSDPGRLEMTW